MRKIAILGTAESREAAPFQDDSWEIWDLAWVAHDHGRAARAFEVHKPEAIRQLPIEGYVEWLATQDEIPIYCVHDIQDMVRAYRKLDVAQLSGLMGRDYFTSSFSYIIAAAILENPDEIGVWGVHLHTQEEYAHQRPCAEFLLGIAHGRGIKVTVTEQSSLLRANFQYGRTMRPVPASGITPDYLDARLASHRKSLDHLIHRANSCGGMLQAVRTLKEQLAACKPDMPLSAVIEVVDGYCKLYGENHRGLVTDVENWRGKVDETHSLRTYAEAYLRGDPLPEPVSLRV